MNRDILGLSEGVWVLMEKCWDQALTTRPRAAEILVLLETASRDWVPPSSEAIASLGPHRPTSQNYFMTEPIDTMSEALATIGAGAVGPREVGQSPPTSNKVEGTATTGSAKRRKKHFRKLIRHLRQGIRCVWSVGK